MIIYWKLWELSGRSSWRAHWSRCFLFVRKFSLYRPSRVKSCGLTIPLFQLLPLWKHIKDISVFSNKAFLSHLNWLVKRNEQPQGRCVPGWLLSSRMPAISNWYFQHEVYAYLGYLSTKWRLKKGLYPPGWPLIRRLSGITCASGARVMGQGSWGKGPGSGVQGTNKAHCSWLIAQGSPDRFAKRQVFPFGVQRFRVVR